MPATSHIEPTARPLETPNPERRSKSKLRELKRSAVRHKHAYVLMSPFMLLFGLFTVLPVILSLIISFTYFNMLEFPRWVGWDNYSRLFLKDDIFLIAVKNFCSPRLPGRSATWPALSSPGSSTSCRRGSGR